MPAVALAPDVVTFSTLAAFIAVDVELSESADPVVSLSALIDKPVPVVKAGALNPNKVPVVSAAALSANGFCVVAVLQFHVWAKVVLSSVLSAIAAVNPLKGTFEAAADGVDQAEPFQIKVPEKPAGMVYEPTVTGKAEAAALFSVNNLPAVASVGVGIVTAEVIAV